MSNTALETQKRGVWLPNRDNNKKHTRIREARGERYLEVQMRNAALVCVCEACKELREQAPKLRLRDGAAAIDEVEQIPYIQ